MKLEELTKVYAYTKAIFSSFDIPTNKMQLECTNQIWYKFLRPFDLDIIYTSIDMYARTNNFVNITQIATNCERMQDLQNGIIKEPYFYIKEISKAVSYSKSKENFEKLSDFSKQIVGAAYKLAQWSNLGENFETQIVPRLLKEINQKLESDTMQKYLKINKALLSTSKKAVLDDK